MIRLSRIRNWRVCKNLRLRLWSFLINHFISFVPSSILDHNNISLIPEQLLRDLTKLRKLWVFSQAVSIFGLALNCVLSHRHLDYNKIEKLPPTLFSSCRDSLNWLLLKNNSLKELDLQSLDGMLNLEWLDLSNNQLTLHSSSFPILPSLLEL